jgi:hypothetical protein
MTFFKLEIESFEIKIKSKPNSRQGVAYLIGDNQIHLKSIDLDTTQRSI